MGKIILDARCIRPGAGGTSTYTRALVERLPRRLPNVPFLFIRHSDQPGPLVSLPNVTERVIGGAPHSPATLFIGSKIPHTSEDLLHVPFPIVPLGMVCPFVMTVHDIMWFINRKLVSEGGFVSLLEAAYQRSVIPPALRKAEVVLTVSHSTANDMARRWPWVHSKVRVTPLGVEADARLIDLEQVAHRIKKYVPEQRRYFLAIGNGSANKNLDTIVRAFGRFARENSDVDLVVIQRMRKTSKRFSAAVAESNASKRIHHFGPVSREDLVVLFHSAVGLVFPSRYEGFGIPVLEAQAYGCPVITSNVSSLPEVAGDAALFCSPEDADGISQAMRRLSREDLLRKQLIERGYVHASRFSWDACVEKTVEAYRKAAPHLFTEEASEPAWDERAVPFRNPPSAVV